MAKKIRPQKHQQQSIISKTLSEKKSASDLLDDECLVISLRQHDRKQGQSWDEWQSTGMLAEAMDVLAGACTGKVSEIFKDKKFTRYGGFPPKHKTEFNHPNHIPEDADWARVHVNGLHCLIGHIVGNTFYLVFLDAKHQFWKSEKK